MWNEKCMFIRDSTQSPGPTKGSRVCDQKLRERRVKGDSRNICKYFRVERVKKTIVVYKVSVSIEQWLRIECVFSVFSELNERTCRKYARKSPIKRKEKQRAKKYTHLIKITTNRISHDYNPNVNVKRALTLSKAIFVAEMRTSGGTCKHTRIFSLTSHSRSRLVLYDHENVYSSSYVSSFCTVVYALALALAMKPTTTPTRTRFILVFYFFKSIELDNFPSRIHKPTASIFTRINVNKATFGAFYFRKKWIHRFTRN